MNLNKCGGEDPGDGDDDEEPVVPVEITMVTLTCEGVVTFTVGNPNANWGTPGVHVSVSSFTGVGTDHELETPIGTGRFVTLNPGQTEPYVVELGTEGWLDEKGTLMGANVMYSLRNHKVSELIDCFEEPVASYNQVIGQVVDSNGSAVAGASVCTPMSGWGGTLCVTTDDQGRFTVGDGTTLFLSGHSQIPVTVTSQNCTAQKIVPYQDGVIEVGTLQLDCVIGEPGDENGGDAPGDGEAVENSFTLTAAHRMCEDQSFRATWTGTNIESLEFALNNTSDDWTSGWLEADPAVGVFTAEIDHHNYDKVGAQVTFTDGTTEQFSANTSNCAAAEAPAPVDPPASNGSGTSGGGKTAAAVTSLPSTGTGSPTAGLLVLASVGVMLLAGAAMITRLGIARR